MIDLQKLENNANNEQKNQTAKHSYSEILFEFLKKT